MGWMAERHHDGLASCPAPRIDSVRCGERSGDLAPLNLDDIIRSFQRICEELEPLPLLPGNHDPAPSLDDDKEVEKIRNILASLDFSKYRRKSSLKSPPFRMDKPHDPSQFCPVQPVASDSSSIQDSKPKIPLSKIHYKKQNSVIRSSSFSQVENAFSSVKEGNAEELPSNSIIAKFTNTFPKKKTPNQLVTKVEIPNSSKSPSFMMNQLSLEVGKELCNSDISIDSAVESVTDEGFVAEMEPVPTVAFASCSVATRQPSLNAELKPAVRVAEAVSVVNPGVRANTVSALEKRKRRKGLCGPVFGLQLPNSEITKTGNGRSLTFPPQRKTSLEEDLEYSSIDSNGLKSLMFPALLPNTSIQDPLRQSSDLSLADSHYCPSEVHEETYKDVIESVTKDLQKIHVEERNLKGYKKKHHSDPGSDKATGECLDFPELISAAFRSEPELKDRLVKPIQESYNEDHIGVVKETPILGDESRQPPVAQSSTNIAGEKGKSPQQKRRYLKKRLRGPYGEMLEEEMKKFGDKPKPSFCDHLNFLQELSEPKIPLEDHPGEESPRPSLFPISQSLDDSQLKCISTQELNTLPKRKISANYPLGRNESEQAFSAVIFPEIKDSNAWTTKNDLLQKSQDTRTHIVVELYETERSYVEALQTLAERYLGGLKNTAVLEQALVEEIFCHIPDILAHHEKFLETLKLRIGSWDAKQKISDVFVSTFTKKSLIDVYTAFINNWKNASEIIKHATQNRPAFAKFLEQVSRETKGKLTLDALLIMPVQRVPRYELLLKELMKHTGEDHPDRPLMAAALREVHRLALAINAMEEGGGGLRGLEQLIEGAVDLAHPDRTFLCHSLVTIPRSLGAKKERALFLFSDLLLITSIKRRGGSNRKASGTTPSPLELNKYKLLLRFPLESLSINKGPEGGLKKMVNEIESLEDDVALLGNIAELASGLSCSHQALDETVREMMACLSRQIQERQSPDSQLLTLELTIALQGGSETLNIIFPSAEKRISWENAFNGAKQKLAASMERRPEFVQTLPIRKTRSGLQMTCAATVPGRREVWVCNSDDHVGQVCVLSLEPEPAVASCTGVAASRLLAVAAVPSPGALVGRRTSAIPPGDSSGVRLPHVDSSEGSFQLDSESSEEEEEGGTPDRDQPTMWIGAEDGSIYIYKCNENIRIQRHKAQLQMNFSVNFILYHEERVLVSLSSGELAVLAKVPGPPGWAVQGSVGLQGPATRMAVAGGRLWCACPDLVQVLALPSLQIQGEVRAEDGAAVGGLAPTARGMWLGAGSAVELVDTSSLARVTRIEMGDAVSRALSGGPDIVLRHKLACLRVTALLYCPGPDLLWVATSAGVLLVVSGQEREPTELSQGHTGQARFLVERAGLVISGGSGFEDFGRDASGRDDSTAHLNLWRLL